MFYEVVLDSGETANKCTIAPLAYREDFRLLPVKGSAAIGPLNASILLHHQGQCITTLQKPQGGFQGIATIDCVWKRLDVLLKRVSGDIPTLVRIPEGFKTSYPRQSIKDYDPEGGLATIEAIFTASALLGHWDPTLLSEYVFGRQFVKLNLGRFLELGVAMAGDKNAQPIMPSKPRNSLQRRKNRGRLGKLKVDSF